MRGDILLILLLLLVFSGVGPWWGYSHNWGYWPGGIVGLILAILLIRLVIP